MAVEENTRTFEVPDDPARRPLRRRSTVRVLVIDDAGRVLLFRDSDPGTGATWWITPGGGIDEGESELAAVRRELAEETGLEVAAEQVIGPLAARRVWHGYSDVVVDQRDTFYAVRTQAFEIDTSGHTEEEQITLQESRWWSRAELADPAGAVLWPVDLTAFLDLLASPERWPLSLPDVEESSVPVRPS
ncbi:NUDIX domain-containing protein [Nocardioides dubius]|uniref:Nudix hydrolase domain-containing protein n=1 Tax=Nocardioides dubius TaxID=317019 RepID=A0ABP4E778_9ACTN